MYTVTVRNSIMIAHSLKGEIFGPAQQLHGATYVVDAEFFAEELTGENIVIDIGYATVALKKVLSHLDYRNLDDMSEFQDKITTTEFLANYIHRQLGAEVAKIFRGRLKVTLRESDRAWASFEGPVE